MFSLFNSMYNPIPVDFVFYLNVDQSLAKTDFIEENYVVETVWITFTLKIQIHFWIKHQMTVN